MANLHNKTAYIDKVLLDNNYYWGLFNSIIDREPYKLYSYSPYVEYLNQFKNSKEINIGWIFTDEETVNEEFEKNGGTFTDEELSNINFNNLINEDFLLNKTK